MSEVLIIIIIYLIAKLSLDILQIQTIKTVPIDQQSIDLLGINSNEEYKSRRYNIEKLKISILRNVVYVGWIIYLLSGGLVIEINSYLESFLLNEYLHNLGVILVVFIVVHLSMLPLSYFSTFVIEDKYGFNTSTKRLFFRDNLVSLLMALILITVMSSVFFYLVSFTEIWWLLLASTMFIFIILSIYIYPTYISPIFNKFDNLDDDVIKSEIRDLSKQTNFSINNLYVMDKSKRTKHPNAYFTGFKNNRRIVFYDTLIDLLSPKEIKAVLAHEIGHYKHNHIFKSLVVSTAVIFIGMFYLSSLINNASYLEFLNLPMNQASQLIALVFTYQVISFFIEPFFSILSRSNEYEADNFASKQVDKEHLVTSLIKLYKSNLSFLIPNKLYAMFYFSHPTILERINNLRRRDD
jgi:STE24 endopeptidase|tara:strand:- start:1002 stop:2228 length:1227 start_codon:yes stop_codon:yes gene_type:complete